jgi:hypothetical protein
MDFSHFKQFDVSAALAWFPIPVPGGREARLRVRPAGDSNRKYVNLRQRLNLQVGFRKKSLSRDDQQKLREADRKLFPLSVVVGWEGIEDMDGNTVEFSVDAAKELFKWLPDHMLDDIRAFCLVPENFYEDEDEVVDLDDLAKN